MDKDKFYIWERLLQNIRKELQSDRDGVQRNLERLKEIQSTNMWLRDRIAENERAEVEILKQM